MTVAAQINHIEITEGISGGKPRIVGHRITVQDIAVFHDVHNLSPAEIATEYGLTLGDVYAALAYYHDNRAAIDDDMAVDEAYIEGLRRTSTSKLKMHRNTNP